MVTLRVGLAFVAMAVSPASCGSAGTGELAPTPEPPLATSHLTLTTSVAEPASARCPMGGLKFGTGRDTNGNGVLERQEIVTIFYRCDTAVAAERTDSTRARFARSRPRRPASR